MLHMRQHMLLHPSYTGAARFISQATCLPEQDTTAEQIEQQNQQTPQHRCCDGSSPYLIADSSGIQQLVALHQIVCRDEG